MNNLDAPGGSSDFQQRLLAIREDPQVRKLAWRWAGAPDLVDDALQTAYCKVATVRDPKRIANLYAYFLTVLRNEAYSLYALCHCATPLEDLERALDPAQHGAMLCGPAPVSPIDETVCNSIRDRTWLERLAANRDCLLAAIPARSADPGCYRAVIYAAAEQVLRDGINAEPSDADTNDAFRAAYPQYFNQLDAPPNTLHQRFRRAREDVKAALQTVVRRDELS